MRTVSVGPNDAGQTLRKFMGKYFSSMPESLLHKYIRKNCAVRLTNGKKEKLSGDALLNEGDVLAFYISDEFFPENRGKAGPGQPEIGRDAFRTLEPRLSVAYEDENILIADKPSGLVVHDSADESYNTLINHILAYLYRKGEYRPDEENVFSPALCNRIDRNTEGLVIAAKNARALAEMNRMIKERMIDKRYLAAVHGLFGPDEKKGEYRSYLRKDASTNTVFTAEGPEEGKLAVTRYAVLDEDRENELSLVEIRLMTGRTHQIRSQFASHGHPLLGDGKYAVNKEDRKQGFRSQALCAYRLEFRPDSSFELLSYLSGKSVLSHVPDFASRFDGCALASGSRP